MFHKERSTWLPQWQLALGLAAVATGMNLRPREIVFAPDKREFEQEIGSWGLFSSSGRRFALQNAVIGYGINGAVANSFNFHGNSGIRSMRGYLSGWMVLK